MSMNRRQFLRTTGGATAGLLWTGALGEALGQASSFVGYGQVLPDPDRVLDLPAGFSYRVLGRKGDLMTDGMRRPSAHDGMAAFRGPGGTTILNMNHEEELIDEAEFPAIMRGEMYDPGRVGGTSSLVLDRELRPIASFMTNAGTARPCAGGPTPWGTWLSCEEVGDEAAGHGYVFEVDPLRAVSRRLPALGRFEHEATGFDARTGILYLTEDTGDSLLYRFRPAEGKSGQLSDGVLEALVLRETASTFPERRPFETAWVKIPSIDPKPEEKSTRKQGQELGALTFARGEGAWFGNGALYFTATSGGAAGLGQVWRLTPGTGTQADKLELYAESRRKEELERPDNIVIHPSGDIYLCEDGPGTNKLVGYTPDGKYFDFAINRLSDSEVAGACFGPDGRTMFLNNQGDGLTFAISGPFRGARSASRKHSVPPPHVRPELPEDFRLAAVEKGYSELEAAALHSIGVPLG